MKLTQKQGMNRRYFEIEGEMVKTKYKTNAEVKEWDVKIENLGDQTLVEAKSKKSTWIVGLSLAIFTVFFLAVYLSAEETSIEPWAAFVIAGAYIFFALIVFLTPSKREIHLIGGSEGLTFFLESPSREEVNHFITIIKKKRKEILLSKYGKVDVDLPEETFMNHLHWLRNQNVISDEEYEIKKDNYKTKKLLR